MSNQNQKIYNITPNAIESQWELLFSRFNKDSDGKISIKELQTFLNSRASDKYNVPPKILAIIAESAHHNADGHISFKEFLHLIEESLIAKSKTTNILNKYIHYTVVPRGSLKLRTTEVDYTHGDYIDKYSCNPPALCMIIVSLIQVMFFTLDVNKLFSYFIDYNPHRRREAWRFLTYMFVHDEKTHLIINLIVQLLLGVPLEMVHRSWRVVLIYLSGVLAGSLATSVLDSTVYLIGASGGVYALITAHVATIIINWSQMEFAKYQLFIFLFLIVFEFIYSQLIYHKIYYIEHYAGAIAGLLVGVYVLRDLIGPRGKKICLFCFVIYVLLMISAVMVYILFPDMFTDEYQYLY